jgi:hypothetical protein
MKHNAMFFCIKKANMRSNILWWFLLSNLCFCFTFIFHFNLDSSARYRCIIITNNASFSPWDLKESFVWGFKMECSGRGCGAVTINFTRLID